MDHLQQAFWRSSLKEQFCQANWNAGIALGWLEDKGIARCNRHAEHPHRDHRWEVKRRDARTNAQRLAHGIDINAGTCALGVFALEHLRDAASIFDHFQPALHIALGIVDDLAVFGTEQLGQILHIVFDQLLEIEHHPRAFLRIGGGPFRLHSLGIGNRGFQQCGVAQRNFGLNFTGRGVPYLVFASARAGGSACYKVIDLTHGENVSLIASSHGARGEGLQGSNPWQMC